MNAPIQEINDRVDRVGRLLREASFGGEFELVPLLGGGNSRAFRIDLAANGPPLFLKEYYQHADDPRDRLGAEFAFATFAWTKGLRTCARPYAMDRDGRCALFSFLDGRKLESREIAYSGIAQCLRFYQTINAHNDTAEARLLPAASEACFCLRDHWECLHRRMQRLKAISSHTVVDKQALEFIHNDLAPACEMHLAESQDAAASLGISARSAIGQRDRCLSPSDFGFHNVLQAADGTLQFLDFEYAGWDDPAKTVCDFFCQPACPVPRQYYAYFAEEVARMTSDPPFHRLRLDLLMPLYELKWCCIMLNDFLPSGSSRRRFALHDLDEATRKLNQLNKARRALNRIRDFAFDRKIA
jgi:thiamine kinase-like enzyme